MFAMIINRLREKMEGEVPRVFSAVFECTLQMITRNFEVRLCCGCCGCDVGDDVAAV